MVFKIFSVRHKNITGIIVKNTQVIETIDSIRFKQRVTDLSDFIRYAKKMMVFWNKNVRHIRFLKCPIGTLSISQAKFQY